MDVALLSQLQIESSFHIQLFPKISNISHLFLFAFLAYAEFKTASLAHWIYAS